VGYTLCFYGTSWRPKDGAFAIVDVDLSPLEISFTGRV
jgi:hypothetical protein